MNWNREDSVVVMCWRREVAAMLDVIGADVDLVSARSTPHALLQVALDGRLVERHRPDVVWSQGLAVPFGGPQVLHLQDIGVFDRTHRGTPRERARRARIARDGRRVDRTIVNSAVMAEAVSTSSLGSAFAPIDIVPNGLDLDAFLKAPPPAERNGRELRILLPQSDQPHKCSHLAAAVLRGVLKQLPSGFTGARLVVPGGAQHTLLRRALAEQRLSHLADFEGYLDRNAMGAQYTACDVVLLTSLTESFSNPAVEAAATGRWLVAPALPVLRETGGPMALLMRSAEPEELAAGIVRAAAREADLGLIERARSHARRFTAGIAVATLRGIFGRLVAE